MAQATSEHNQSSPQVDALQRAFCMECEIDDLAAMARIAELILHDVIGETEFEGDEVIRHSLSHDSINRAVFAVSHVAKLIEAFQRRFVRHLACAVESAAPTAH